MTLAGAADLRWLADDGWTDEVTDSGPGDVVHVPRGTDLGQALGHAGPNATLVIEQDRSIRGRRRQQRLLGSDPSITAIRRFLVTPNLEDPRRFVPLDTGTGLRWLLGSPPDLQGGRRGRALRSRVRSRALAVLASLDRPRLAEVMGAALGHGLIVAARGGAGQRFPFEHGTTALLTSGHDTGSRAVLVPIAGGGERRVSKIAARPRFNGNIDAEAARVDEIRRQLSAGGRSPDLLPDTGRPFDIGPLRAVTESYGGRWTAADLCHRLPHTRIPVLDQVMEALDGLARATTGDTIAWSRHAFEQYLGQPLDRYRDETTDDRTVTVLRDRLLSRSDAVDGSPLPLIRRHYDLGPWNVLFADDRAGLTIIDWELGPPRAPEAWGPAGADHLYFAKYWLHTTMETRSVGDELTAFPFLAEDSDDRAHCANVLARSMQGLEVSTALIPLLQAHVWVEAALHAIERSRSDNGDGGGPGHYLGVLADNVDRLLAFWPQP